MTGLWQAFALEILMKISTGDISASQTYDCVTYKDV